MVLLLLQTTRKLQDLLNPTTNTDAATKFYVDDPINNEPSYIKFRYTGINNSRLLQLSRICIPAANKKNGSYAHVATTTLTGATVSGISFQDTNAANPGYINKSPRGSRCPPSTKRVVLYKILE